MVLANPIRLHPDQKVVIKIDSTQVKGMPHRRFNGLVGVVRETGRRAVIIDVMVGDKKKTVISREGTHRPADGGEAVELSAEVAPPSAQKKTLTLSEAHQILEKIDVEKADQIQKRTLDYTSKFAKSTPEAAKKLKKQLETDCGLSEGEATEVVNIMPKSIEELRTFTAGWRKLLPTETLEKILKILKSKD